MQRLKQLVGVRALQIRPQGLLVVAPTSIDSFLWFVASMLAVFFLAGIGNASPFKQIPMLFEKRQAGGVTRWTAAIAAYGPSVLAGILGSATGATGSAVAFFWGLSVFFALNTVLNWWVYARRGAPLLTVRGSPRLTRRHHDDRPDAEAVINLPAEDLAHADGLALAESALHAPAATFGGAEFCSDRPHRFGS